MVSCLQLRLTVTNMDDQHAEAAAALTSSELVDFHGIGHIGQGKSPVPADEPRRYAGLDKHEAVQQQHNDENEPCQCVGHHQCPADGPNQPEESNGKLVGQK